MSKGLSTVWAVLFVSFMFWGSAWAMKTAPVSPVGEEVVAVIGQNCPQFSWSYVEGAAGYEVVVFEGEERLSYEEKASFSEALIEKVIASPGLTWAPEGGGCLKSGKGYVWYVRAVDAKGPGIWSEGARFRVDEKAMVEALREPVQEVVREYFSGEQVVKEKLVGLEGKIREEVKRELEGGRLIGVGSTPKVLAVEGPTNTFYGTGAGASITAGSENSFFGANAGNKTTDGYSNTFLGYSAGFSNTTGYYNTFLGRGAGYYNSTGNWNTFLGRGAGYSNTTGYDNTFLGRGAGYSNTTGYDNTFLGNYAGNSNSGGTNNTFLGYEAGYSNISGYYNTVVGGGAGFNATGSNNTFLGHYAGGSNQTGSSNTFLGYQAGYQEAGSNKLYIANSSTSTPLIYGEFNNHSVRINGAGNGVPGYPAYTLDVSNLGVTRSALHFSLNGTDTGGWITSVADNNFWLSSGAMWDTSLGGWVQKSPDGLAVMAGSGPAGYRVNTRSGCAVGTVCPPTTRLTINYSGNVGLGIAPVHPLHLAGGAYSDGAHWIDGSSREYKDNIRDLTREEALRAFNGLNPVAFTYKAAGGEQHIGFIAEDVPELVATKDRKGLSPMDIVAVLTKVVQEQQESLKELKTRNELLEQRLLGLEGKTMAGR